MAAVTLSTVVDVIKALGHPGRLRILAMLRQGELCVCQMTAVLRLAPSTVSGHLSDLRRSGLVAERKDAKWVHYRVTDEEPLRTLVHDVLALAEADPRLREDADLIRSLRRVPVETLCRVGLDLTAVGVGRSARPARRSTTHTRSGARGSAA